MSLPKFRFLIALAVGAVGVNLTSPSYAAGLADADAAVARADYASAIPLYESLTQAGDTVAMVKLANLLQKGQGIQRDLGRALALYKTAAASGNADAEYSLGNLYLLGEGVPQDDDWAFTYYRQAAQQGHPLALKNVNEFYRAAGVTPPGSGNPAPEATPAAAAPPATESVVATTPVELTTDELNAIDRARAAGIQVNLESSVAGIANNAHDLKAMPNAPVRLGLADIKQMLQNGDVAHARAELEILAGNDEPEAQYLLAKTLSNTQGSQTDREQALFWLRRAAEGGYADAQFELAEHQMRGDGVPLDEAEAVSWYRAAARQGHRVARQQLDRIYRDAGLPVPDAETTNGPPTKSIDSGANGPRSQLVMPLNNSFVGAASCAHDSESKAVA
ncbi:MAG: SEL1-like repeat protein [Gammaproteobacteria bacterium]|nr:SEL1-like repeat protein [Gammaproteobacteria bacterium]